MTNTAEQAATGKVVSIHYTLTSSQGQVLDRSGDEPLSYLHGAENIVPGLEKQIQGHGEGDKFQAVVPPEEAYGERRGDAQKQVPRDAFPEDVEVEPGMQFAAQGPDGGMIPLWVMAVDDGQVTVDLNHPLAGETLTFDIEVVGVRDATAEEQEQGQVHGAGGAHD
jgi:FKBP-type peptidyl-prolyl cis-trans isomerase SlyD